MKEGKMSFGEKFRDVTYSAGAIFPWTYGGVLRRNIAEGTVLDMGCGKAWAWRRFIDKSRRQRFHSTGVDISDTYLDYCRKHKMYDEIVCGDVTKLGFADKSYDVVLLLQILSHLPKEKGLEILEHAERIARKQVIIGTENEIVDIPGKDHVSAWSPAELSRMGYKVTGYGFKPFDINGHDSGLAVNISRFTALFPFTYNKPEKAYQMLGIKNL